jgi:hypothetical protein
VVITKGRREIRSRATEVLVGSSETILDGNSWSDNETDLLQQGYDEMTPVELLSEPSVNAQLCPSERHDVPAFSGMWVN